MSDTSRKVVFHKNTHDIHRSTIINNTTIILHGTIKSYFISVINYKF